MDNNYCLIQESELKELIECRARLCALEYGGVDNWSWYSDSFSDYLECAKYNSFSDLVESEIKRYKKYEGE